MVMRGSAGAMKLRLVFTIFPDRNEAYGRKDFLTEASSCHFISKYRYKDNYSSLVVYY